MPGLATMSYLVSDVHFLRVTCKYMGRDPVCSRDSQVRNSMLTMPFWLGDTFKNKVEFPTDGAAGLAEYYSYASKVAVGGIEWRTLQLDKWR